MEPFRIHRGVTLVELIVVLGIIGVLSTVVVTSHASFSKTILLSSTAYDIALTIRNAQNFGLGSRVTTGSIYKNEGYGVHFTPASSSFILFADRNAPTTHYQNCHPSRDVSAPDAVPGNCAYDAGELVQEYKLGNGMKFRKIHWYGAPYEIASTAFGHAENGAIDIVFARPNNDPFVTVDYGQGTREGTLANVCIELESPQKNMRAIMVMISGEVSVIETCPGVL